MNTEGRVSECRIVVTAGDPSLDRATCVTVHQRGRYTPALDGAGKPSTSWAIMSVHWQLPRY